MDINLGKLLAYFVGVVFTFIIVMWIVSQFIPWWANQLVANTRRSAEVQELGVTITDLWNEAMRPDTAVVTVEPPPTQAPPAVESPQPTTSPVETPETGGNFSSQDAQVERTYVVQSGDTLYSIGRRFGVSVAAIKQRNELTNDTISIGQTLIIP